MDLSWIKKELDKDTKGLLTKKEIDEFLKEVSNYAEEIEDTGLLKEVVTENITIKDGVIIYKKLKMKRCDKTLLFNITQIN